MADTTLAGAPELELEAPDGYELIDDQLKEKPMGAESDGINCLLLARLTEFVREHKLGRVFGAQTGYKCFPKKRKVRKPDTSFVASGRLKDNKPPKGDIDIVPDLIAEVVSPNDTYEDVASRVPTFNAVSVKLIWVISPETRTVLVRRADGSCAELDETGTLSGEDVLPGFACPVAELFV